MEGGDRKAPPESFLSKICFLRLDVACMHRLMNTTENLRE